jgi:hypothetical protein
MTDPYDYPIVICSSCGMRNRIRPHRLRYKPVCGQCRADLYDPFRISEEVRLEENDPPAQRKQAENPPMETEQGHIELSAKDAQPLEDAPCSWLRRLAKLSTKDIRILEYLYCQTALTVDELACTDDLQNLYQQFVGRAESQLTLQAFYTALRDLERAGRLRGKTRCLKCNRLKPRIVAYLCPECYERIRGIRLPPGARREPKLIVGIPAPIWTSRKGRHHLNSVEEDPDAYRPNLEPD